MRLRPGMPRWPNSAGFGIDRTLAFDQGDDVNVSRLEMDVHCGTHVEGPLHYIDGGDPLEATPIEVLVGVAYVASIPVATEIGPRELEAAVLPLGTQRLLLRTRNSELGLAGQGEFRRDYVALTLDGARWVAEREIRLLGIDYLSVQRMDDDAETHRVLLRAGVTILEGLDLRAVAPGQYRLTCLPLRIADAEAAPARAILEPLE
jgi:arylformamidase